MTTAVAFWVLAEVLGNVLGSTISAPCLDECLALVAAAVFMLAQDVLDKLVEHLGQPLHSGDVHVGVEPAEPRGPCTRCGVRC